MSLPIHVQASDARPGPSFANRARHLLARTLWPTYLSLILVGIIWAESSQVQGPARGALALGSILVISVFERVNPLDRAQILVAERATLHDLGHLLANTLAGIISGSLSIGSGWLVVNHIAPKLSEFAIWPTDAPWFIQCALALIAADFLGYWVHRAEHRLPALWAYHVVHHDIERLHILRGSREHFATNLIRGFLINVPLVLLGAPIEALFVYQVLIITQGSIAHGNLSLEIPDPVHRWIVTPAVHRIHHAKARKLSDSNFASVTPVWDRLFHTWTDPIPHPAPEIGVEGDAVPTTFAGQLAHPFRRWLGFDA